MLSCMYATRLPRQLAQGLQHEMAPEGSACLVAASLLHVPEADLGRPRGHVDQRRAQAGLLQAQAVRRRERRRQCLYWVPLQCQNRKPAPLVSGIPAVPNQDASASSIGDLCSAKPGRQRL
jgi:hypothetical protein